MTAFLAGCGATADRLFCDHDDCTFTDEEWQRLQALSPMPAVPEDRSNAYRDISAAAALGQRFFFDPRFSGLATQVDALGNPTIPARAAQGVPTGVSCATCHDLQRGGADVTSMPGNVSAGAGWTDVNALSVINSAYQKLWFWNGRADSSWALAAAVAESRTTMNGNRLKTFWTIVDHYRAEYDAIFTPDGQLPADVTTSADLAAVIDTTTGSCGAILPCPAGCTVAATTRTTSDLCWPLFPLQGKPGKKGSGCNPADPTEPFGDAWDCMVPDTQRVVTRVLVNWAKALDAFQALLVTGATPFDRFVAEGPSSAAISPAAKRGARLFVGKAACIDCHNGPLLTDLDFHNVGVAQEGPFVPPPSTCPAPDDMSGASCLPWGAYDGLIKLAGSAFLRSSVWSSDPSDTSRLDELHREIPEELEGAWRTPGLRNVALTAPYMHDGVFPTLADVVRHYSDGLAPGAVGVPAAQFKPLMLTATEQSDLVAFLESLTAPALDPSLTKDGGLSP